MRPSGKRVPPAARDSRSSTRSLHANRSLRTSSPCSAKASRRAARSPAAARPCACSSRQERARVGERFPDLRQERRALRRRTRARRRRRRVAAARARRPRSRRRSARARRRAATPRSSRRELVARERRKARVAERGGARVRAHVLAERRGARSSEPMQPRSSPALRSVTNVAPGSRATRASAAGAARRPELAPIAARAIASSTRAAIGVRSLLRGGSCERERRVADDARRVARGVAGVAQVEQLGAQPAAARRHEQAVDRRRAACLLVVERRRQREDRLGGVAVDRCARRRSDGSARGRSSRRSSVSGPPHSSVEHFGHLARASRRRRRTARA